VLDAKIAEMGLRSSAAGMMLGLLGLSASTLKPFLRVFVSGMSGDIGNKISTVLKESESCFCFLRVTAVSAGRGRVYGALSCTDLGD
jgi:hypothetical protein